jgi:choice-of-anchor A domain-containing protein
MGRRTAVFGVVLVAAAVATLSPPRAAPAPPVARTAACDALGAADGFAVFSHQNITDPDGETMTGRIAAAGNVTLGSGINVTGSPSPAIIAGGNFTAGKSGGGGTVNGGVRYGGSADVASNFVVNGGLKQGAPGIDFDKEFNDLALLSVTWAEEPQTDGVQVVLQPWGALEFHGYSTGLNVFNITSTEQSNLVQGIQIKLDKGPQPGTSAPPSVLINVTTAIPLSLGPSYFDLGAASADRLIWNLPHATGITFTKQVAWKGLILAPNASVSTVSGAQLTGQIIAKDVPAGSWVLTGQAQSVCPPGPTPPGPEPDTSLELEALCVDPFGNLAMRVANTGDRDREVHWSDIGVGKADQGDFTALKNQYQYFNVRGGDGDSRILMIADPADPVRFDPARGTDQRCGGRITVAKRTTGDAPPGPWTVTVSGVGPDGSGVVTRSAQLEAGGSAEFAALGGYQSGPAPFGDVVGGIPYVISEPDPLGGKAEISANPVEIFGFTDPDREQNELVTITNHYPDTGGGGGEPPIAPPTDATLPPGAPDPPPGPGLDAGSPGTVNPDLVVTHSITPGRVRVGDTVQSVTRVRNAGPVAADAVVARELPQYRRLAASRVARVLSLSTSAGRCTQRRPVRCELGRLAPGAEVVIRSRALMLIAAPLISVNMASTPTPESNTTNNMALAPVVVRERAPNLRVGISAPPSGRVGVRLSYRVRVTGTGRHGARFVRLCAARAATLTEIHGDGTFGVRGARCRDIRSLPSGRTVSFAVSGVPAAAGQLRLRATATAVDLAGTARARTQVPITGPVACGSAARRMRC